MTKRIACRCGAWSVACIHAQAKAQKANEIPVLLSKLIRMRHGDVWSSPYRPGPLEFFVEHGCIWLMPVGAARDIVLRPGQRYRIAGDAKVVILALDPSIVRIRAEAPSIRALEPLN